MEPLSSGWHFWLVNSVLVSTLPIFKGFTMSGNVCLRHFPLCLVPLPPPQPDSSAPPQTPPIRPCHTHRKNFNTIPYEITRALICHLERPLFVKCCSVSNISKQDLGSDVKLHGSLTLLVCRVLCPSWDCWLGVQVCNLEFWIQSLIYFSGMYFFYAKNIMVHC